MRKVILSLAVSFDGFIEGPNGEIDWIVFDQEGGNELNSFLEEIDTIFFGRVSYELWGTYKVTEQSSVFEKEFYATLDKMDKYVFSSKRDNLEGNPIIIRGDIETLVKDLKEKPGKHIWLYGGAGLITTFMNLGLVDEFRIAIIPVILGKGKPLFKDIARRLRLKLKAIKTSTSGVIMVYYDSDR